MQKHYSLVHAEKVLKFARAYFKGKRSDITVQLWANSREQGFHLVNYVSDKALSFAQQRNSDQTLIVFGAVKDFDTGTGSPSEEIWGKNCIYFDVDKDIEAGKWIAKYFA